MADKDGEDGEASAISIRSVQAAKNVLLNQQYCDVELQIVNNQSHG